jgi:hypothetical protein
MFVRFFYLFFSEFGRLIENRKKIKVFAYKCIMIQKKSKTVKKFKIIKFSILQYFDI